MSNFEKEERYVVIKISDLEQLSSEVGEDVREDLRVFMSSYPIPTRECVVVESDWPNYDHVWGTVEQVANGTWEEARQQVSEGVSAKAWMERTAEALGVGQRGDSLLELSRALTHWIDTARGQDGDSVGEASQIPGAL